MFKQLLASAVFATLSTAALAHSVHVGVGPGVHVTAPGVHVGVGHIDHDGHRHGGFWRNGIWIAPIIGVGACEYYHERYLETGSRYWWRRWQLCLE